MKWFFTLASIIVVVDQFTKKLAVMFLRERESITIISDWLKLTYAENKGIAFGVEFAPQLVMITLVSAISIIVVIYVLRSGNRSRLFLLPFSLIFGGGIGNLIDRITVGSVIDFIHFDLYQGFIMGSWVSLWPIFNIADSAITIGACMLVFMHGRIFPEPLAAGEPDVR
ncbi:MAG: signal peptidase II [Chlorobium sp.]|jgi:signal peptidase II|uniref:signal peptidase II n=1 Tax=Chlorobium sp. TaxID=1095 RepID=UPI0025C237C0|nr:signal peptidase II [Chlorobium sp.]MCF8216298.1 signal peptidase II [Chlorobium sp.]MCF8271200.1 signal peptidase II [Chlorobium sp.]MCF8287536.1 signal peptidase II [Chlorobium sp.]MCF8291113.1 signal peptidase II [Chlorobium sp.]MCF8385170.1 signal peptidase II [Chlorobium sp.]